MITNGQIETARIALDHAIARLNSATSSERQIRERLRGVSSRPATAARAEARATKLEADHEVEEARTTLAEAERAAEAATTTPDAIQAARAAYDEMIAQSADEDRARAASNEAYTATLEAERAAYYEQQRSDGENHHEATRATIGHNLLRYTHDEEQATKMTTRAANTYAAKHGDLEHYPTPGAYYRAELKRLAHETWAILNEQPGPSDPETANAIATAASVCAEISQQDNPSQRADALHGVFSVTGSRSDIPRDRALRMARAEAYRFEDRARHSLAYDITANVEQTPAGIRAAHAFAQANAAQYARAACRSYAIALHSNDLNDDTARAVNFYDKLHIQANRAADAAAEATRQYSTEEGVRPATEEEPMIDHDPMRQTAQPTAADYARVAYEQIREHRTAGHRWTETWNAARAALAPYTEDKDTIDTAIEAAIDQYEEEERRQKRNAIAAEAYRITYNRQSKKTIEEQWTARLYATVAAYQAVHEKTGTIEEATEAALEADRAYHGIEPEPEPEPRDDPEAYAAQYERAEDAAREAYREAIAKDPDADRAISAAKWAAAKHIDIDTASEIADEVHDANERAAHDIRAEELHSAWSTAQDAYHTAVNAYRDDPTPANLEATKTTKHSEMNARTKYEQHMNSLIPLEEQRPCDADDDYQDDTDDDAALALAQANAATYRNAGLDAYNASRQRGATHDQATTAAHYAGITAELPALTQIARDAAKTVHQDDAHNAAKEALISAGATHQQRTAILHTLHKETLAHD